MKNFIIFSLAFTLAMSFGCSEDEGPSCFKCVYEKRSTGCGGSGFGAWEEGSSEHDASTIRDDLTPQSYCDLVYPASDLACELNCCISFQFKNVVVASCD
ncbi:hypothetical protein QQ020_30675 [Fulvivirgaceae bacterium BMA12]|uniref:Lipoprotein n=1 Tax=Agaribacillus aureus TaxID=3051825 RepID=A0ABT8LFY0_9BACT|nr:hypothetical protein [Fulvivirgaceae bacterium BMA12]